MSDCQYHFHFQEQIDELVRSFRTFELIAQNPSLIAEMDANKDLAGDRMDMMEERRRREAVPTASDGGSDPVPNDGQAPYLGPYSYPMFSGKLMLIAM